MTVQELRNQQNYVYHHTGSRRGYESRKVGLNRNSLREKTEQSTQVQSFAKCKNRKATHRHLLRILVANILLPL